MDGGDGSEGVETQLVIEEAAHQAVHDGDLVAFIREVESRGPSAVPVAADYHDLFGSGG